MLESESCIGISAVVEKNFERYLQSHKNGKVPNGVYKRVLREIEEKLLEVALNYTQGNQIKAAKILGINRNTLHRKILKFKLDEKF